LSGPWLCSFAQHAGAGVPGAIWRPETPANGGKIAESATFSCT
jgi:hypothetical protein